MAEAAQTRVIKRYANRKLYDTRDSRYVTLDRIAEIVRSGEEVKVLDNKSQKDMTKVTLAQIIYEEQKSGNATAWSVQSLRGFIQEGREKLVTSIKEGPVGKLVGRAEELGHEVYSAADDRVRGVTIDDGTVIEVQAAPEELYEVTGRDGQHLLSLAWQIGNRHLAAQIEGDRLLIRRDPVIRDMLEGLGAQVQDLSAPFDPEGGAYGDAHSNHHHHHD